jgi:sporulation protein YlmC with PRC-barrel domain
MAKHEDRGVRDQAGIGPDPIEPGRLVGMDEIDDFKIAEGEPDVRGWDVYSSAGAFVGTVDDLLIDPELRQVVMLEIDLKDQPQHGRAPLKAAWLDRERRRVIIDSASLDQQIRASRATTAADEVIVERQIEGDDVVVREDVLDTRPTRDLPPPDTRF